jgi:hypothetical protein
MGARKCRRQGGNLSDGDKQGKDNRQAQNITFTLATIQRYHYAAWHGLEVMSRALEQRNIIWHELPGMPDLFSNLDRADNLTRSLRRELAEPETAVA